MVVNKKMSVRVSLSEISDVDIESFEKHLIIEENTRQGKQHIQRCPWLLPPRFNTVRRDETHAFLPFQWGNSYYDKRYRTPRSDCAPTKITFQGKLREEQNVILKETVELLNKHGSTVMAIYPGGGKCLGEGTPILLYNGLIKNVEDIIKGDLLVGDDGAPRIVQSTCRGTETMYRIRHADIPIIGFQCNRSHILTLWDPSLYKLVDMDIPTYLIHPHRLMLRGAYFDFDSENFPLEQRRKSIVGRAISNNGLFWLPYSEITLREVMLSGLCVVAVEEQKIYFEDPFGVLVDTHKRVMITFPLSVRKTRENTYYGFEISGNGRFLLGNGIVTHNTITSLAISAIVGTRTMILVNKIVLIDQWIATIQKVFGEHARIQHLKTKSKIQPGCQFYIMNALNVSKRDFSDYQKLQIGFVIVDECHLIMTKIFSRAMSYLCPRYLLGLSATPFRPDGFDALIELYFGLRKVVRKLYRPHIVYTLETKIKIVADKNMRGETLWNTVIDEQTGHAQRNRLIMDICARFHDRSILILSKRIHQIDTLYEGLRETQSVTLLKDGETSFDKDARILIATFQKVGTGFSHDKLDMLILATDAEEYFIQYLGRVFRRPDTQPIIVDIIDDNPILRRHFLTRRGVYQECGGKISPYPAGNLPIDTRGEREETEPEPQKLVPLLSKYRASKNP